MSALVVGLLAAGLLAQSDAVRTDPRVVRIDAVATDTKGRPIADLDATEFEVIENGMLLTIESARFSGTSDEPGAYALFLDEYHVSPGTSSERARVAALRFVESCLRPDDLLVVLKPLDSLRAIELTADRMSALETIRTFEGRSGDYKPRFAFERSYIAGARSRIDAARSQIVTSALNALAARLGGRSSARKSLTVVSEGFLTPSGGVRASLPTIQSAIRTANAANVSVYLIDPSASNDDAVAAQVIASDDGPELRDLAEETDGTTIPGGAGLDGGLRRLASDASAYYLIALQVSGGQIDGRFHPVQVRVTRPGVRLRARSGYLAPSITDVARATLTTRPAPSVHAFRLTRRISPLIRPWIGLSRAPGGLIRVKVVWEPTGGIPGSPRRTQPPTQVSLRAATSDGGTVYEGVIHPWEAGASATGTMPAAAVFDVPAGRLRLEMLIQNAAAERLDTDVRDVQVRPLVELPAIGTAEVLRARTALEFRRLASDQDAVPTPAREFSRFERLLLRVPVYAPSGNVRVQGRLRSRIGGLMRDLAVAGPDGDLFQIDVPLAGLAPGEYSIEVTAADEVNQRTSSLEFRVIP